MKKSRHIHRTRDLAVRFLIAFFGVGVLPCSSLPQDFAGVRTQSSSSTLLQATPSDQILHLIVGHSRVFSSETRLTRIYVGDPSVIHTFNSGTKEILVTAKTTGTSSLVAWDCTGAEFIYTVVVDADTAALQRTFADTLPYIHVGVSANQGKTILTGTVDSAADLDLVSKLAATYSKEVLNDVQIAAPQEKQVELKLRIVEVDRTKLEQFGVNFFSTGNNTTGATTQQFGSVQYTPTAGSRVSALTFDPLNLLFYSASSNVGVSIRDLEQHDVLQVLAEPTLTTLSGQPAKFLSGGEFPFPVVQGGLGASTAVTIMFRPYGVKVDFTPIVSRDGYIRLKVSPEVSTLDYSNAVTISGFTIPALSTRRAETEVEIRNGESFIVSGLLDHRTTENLSKVPGIGDVPILGQLFRSRNLNHSVVELVVVVTARIVEPPSSAPLIQEPVFPLKNLNSGDFDRSLKSQTEIGIPHSSHAQQ